MTIITSAQSGCLSQQATTTSSNAATDPEATTAPAHLLRGMITVSCEPGTPTADQAAALELDLLLMLDPSAERDLLQILFNGQDFDVTTQAGLDRMFAILQQHGAIDPNCSPVCQTVLFALRFHARPLIDLLKKLPHRESGLGLARDLVQDCTVNN